MKKNNLFFAIIMLVSITLTSCGQKAGNTVNNRVITDGYIAKTSFTNVALSNTNKMWNQQGEPFVAYTLDYFSSGANGSYMDGNGLNNQVVIDYNIASDVTNNPWKYKTVKIYGVEYIHVTITAYTYAKWFDYNPQKTIPAPTDYESCAVLAKPIL